MNKEVIKWPEQAKVDKNVYFSQLNENTVEGTYVNAKFIKFEVDKILSTEELEQLAKSLYEIYKENSHTKKIIDKYEKMYDENPNWDLGWPAPTNDGKEK